MSISGIQRKEVIKDLIERNKRVSVSELSVILEVSRVTVRKYLKELEREKFLRTTYGGAFLLKAGRPVSDVLSPAGNKEFRDAIHAISEKAFSLLRENEIIFLDSGEASFALASRMKKVEMRMVVVSNSISVISEIARNPLIRVFVPGGMLKSDQMDFSGNYTREKMKKIFFNQSFLEVEALSSRLGLTEKEHNTGEIHEAVIKNSGTVNLLADSSRIGKISLLQYGNLGELRIPKRLITDSNADRHELKRIKDRFNIEVVEANPA